MQVEAVESADGIEVVVRDLRPQRGRVLAEGNIYRESFTDERAVLLSMYEYIFL